jgi:riboflavin biosynthesis pyrimidine reductase
VGGPTLAAETLRAGLVDEYQVFLTPVVVGGGTPSLPAGLRVGLELLGRHSFGNGVVYLRYRVVNRATPRNETVPGAFATGTGRSSWQ